MPKNLEALLDAADNGANSFRSSGLTSCLVEYDWMRSTSSEAEWKFHLIVERELRREALASGSESAALMSDGQGYNYCSELIAELVAERRRKYGPVSELYSSPSSRHLVFLSLPQQRLSRVREYPSAWIGDVEKIVKEKAARKNAEVRFFSDPSIRLRDEFAFCSGKVFEIVDTMTRKTQTLLPVIDPDEVRPESTFHFATDMFSEVEVQVHVEGGENPQTRSLFLKVYVNPPLDGTHRFPLRMLMPGALETYSHSKNHRELSVAVHAWSLALSISFR